MSAPASTAAPAAAPIPEHPTPPSQWRRRLARYDLLWIPVLGFLAFFFIVPLFGVLVSSVTTKTGHHLTGQWFSAFLGEPAYVEVLYNTLITALLSTAVCLIMGYPVAFYLSGLKPGWALSGLLAMVLLPFATSTLVKTYAWIVLFGRYGWVNKAMQAVGLSDEPQQLLYNRSAVIIGMSYSLLPYMVLSLFSVMRGIDRGLFRAARSLGAGPLRIVRSVLLPLSLPGLAAGCVLTFILGIGYFITPALMGGPRDTMIAQIVQQSIQTTLDYHFAAAASVVLLVVTLVVYLLSARLLGLERMLSSRP